LACGVPLRAQPFRLREGSPIVPDRIKRHLLLDDSVLLDVDPRLESAVSSWIPLASCRSGGGDQAESRIFVHTAPLLGVKVPNTTPTLRIGSVGVWLNQESGRAMLGAAERDCAGAVDLQYRQATLVASACAEAVPRLHTALTLATALLLGRLGRALVHAGAVVQPGGRAWLLICQQGNGGHTAFVRLMMAGWPSLAIHSVVLRENGVRGSIVVEGLPEREGAAQMEPGGGRHVGSADLAGVLILRSTPPQPTLVVRRPETDLLSALEPESPWLRLDQPGAAGILRAMHGGLRLPTFELLQGLDTYADHARLADVLDALPHHTTN
jgi:hypothetical protein